MASEGKVDEWIMVVNFLFPDIVMPIEIKTFRHVAIPKSYTSTYFILDAGKK